MNIVEILFYIVILTIMIPTIISDGFGLGFNINYYKGKFKKPKEFLYRLEQKSKYDEYYSIYRYRLVYTISTFSFYIPFLALLKFPKYIKDNISYGAFPKENIYKYEIFDLEKYWKDKYNKFHKDSNDNDTILFLNKVNKDFNDNY